MSNWEISKRIDLITQAVVCCIRNYIISRICQIFQTVDQAVNVVACIARTIDQYLLVFTRQTSYCYILECSGNVTDFVAGCTSNQISCRFQIGQTVRQAVGDASCHASEVDGFDFCNTRCAGNSQVAGAAYFSNFRQLSRGTAQGLAAGEGDLGNVVQRRFCGGGNITACEGGNIFISSKSDGAGCRAAECDNALFGFVHCKGPCRRRRRRRERIAVALAISIPSVAVQFAGQGFKDFCQCVSFGTNNVIQYAEAFFHAVDLCVVVCVDTGNLYFVVQQLDGIGEYRQGIALQVVDSLINNVAEARALFNSVGEIFFCQPGSTAGFSPGGQAEIIQQEFHLLSSCGFISGKFLELISLSQQSGDFMNRSPLGDFRSQLIQNAAARGTIEQAGHYFEYFIFLLIGDSHIIFPFEIKR